MNAMFVYTASSCGVIASGMSETAPTVPWIVSSRVRPVNTRIVSVCSSGVSVFHDWMSFDSGTFSGSQKLLTRRFQTSTSLSSWMLVPVDRVDVADQLQLAAGVCRVVVGGIHRVCEGHVCHSF